MLELVHRTAGFDLVTDCAIQVFYDGQKENLMKPL